MKLIGSKTENDFRLRLIKSHKALFSDEEDELLQVLQKHFSNMKTAYVIDWTPDDGQDIYTVLINTDLVAVIDIDPDNHIIPVVTTSTLKEYIKKLSKSDQIKLSVAIDLAEQDINSKK